MAFVHHRKYNNQILMFVKTDVCTYMCIKFLKLKKNYPAV